MYVYIYIYVYMYPSGTIYSVYYDMEGVCISACKLYVRLENAIIKVKFNEISTVFDFDAARFAIKYVTVT